MQNINLKHWIHSIYRQSIAEKKPAAVQEWRNLAKDHYKLLLPCVCISYFICYFIVLSTFALSNEPNQSAYFCYMKLTIIRRLDQHVQLWRTGGPSRKLPLAVAPGTVSRYSRTHTGRTLGQCWQQYLQDRPSKVVVE